jgi:hypothetical protein
LYWGFELRLLPLESCPRHFCFSDFSADLMLFSRLASDCDLLTSVSGEAGITDVYHHDWLVLWDRVSLHFCQDLPQNCDPPISASQVAGITAVSYHS